MSKLCLYCKSEIPVTNNYKRAKYCKPACYHKSMNGKAPKNIKQCIDAAARMRRGCLNRTRENADEWFWSKVKAGAHGCKIWTGARVRGYGMVSRFEGSSKRAHRISFWLHTGYWPNGILRHTCDNPACVNPQHLVDGTHAENNKDASERGRLKNNGTRKLKARDVRFIRTSNLSHKELADMLGVEDSTVLRARTGQTWKWV